MSKISIFEKALKQEVENHSIYVWGGSGELCCNVTEEWIRRKESRCDGGKHADDAVKAWKDVMSGPYRNVARCFDCSGYISFCLIQAQALNHRTDCDGLYDLCDKTDSVENGTLLFRVNKDNPNDETHVGAYLDGYVYESKGRAYGVVPSVYKKSAWAKSAWVKALPHDEPSPEPHPEPTYLIKVHGRVKVRHGNGKLTKKICTVGIKGQDTYLPYLGQAKDSPYWYMTEVEGQSGFITSDPKYTEIVEVTL